MKINLELVCSWCNDKIVLEVDEEEYDSFTRTGTLIEGSEAYHELFDGFGWVLKQNIFCDICKYDHSECYKD